MNRIISVTRQAILSILYILSEIRFRPPICFAWRLCALALTQVWHPEVDHG